MSRNATIDDAELIDRLTTVFRDVGYDGASLTILSQATGLKKASLYHRFPGGKEQMAREVLLSAHQWLTDNILAPLQSNAPPERRIQSMVKSLNAFYSGGKQACLLNMLSSSHIQKGPFTDLIKGVFKDWIDTLTVVLVDLGLEKKVARSRAERAVAMLQGALVLSRGMGTAKPFRDVLDELPKTLLGNGRLAGGRFADQ